jgi:formylglycine-generating enzyme required for sulfatase activity
MHDQLAKPDAKRVKHMVEQYVDEAIRFVPGIHRGVASPIRVARTLVTCRVAAEVFNELKMPEESGASYRYLNVHNPRCPLAFDCEERRWRCPAALDHHPVWGLNWAAAQLVCRHLGGRLPWAVEWESFASNNDPGRIYPWGNTPPTPVLANYDEHYGGTTAVGSFPPSEIGLYDLAGNLGEWCQDWFDTDCRVPMERLVKGGAWSKGARYLAIAASRGKWARIGTTTIGVRPVWDD